MITVYYEDQEEESLRRSKDFVANRLPKFLGYFERVLGGKASGDGPWLYGGQLTYADLVLFQVGCSFLLFTLPSYLAPCPYALQRALSFSSSLSKPKSFYLPEQEARGDPGA